MAALTPHKRVLVTLPPPLDSLAEESAAQAGLSVPAYLVSLVAKAHKIKHMEPIRGGRPKKISTKSEN